MSGKSELKYFKCLDCGRSFGTLAWGWWSLDEDDPICEEKCPYCKSSVIMTTLSDVISAARDFVKFHHKSQKRQHGTPYWMHPEAVSKIIENELPVIDTEMTVIALLHDILEDTNVEKDELEYRFGKGIADNVEILSKNFSPNAETYFEKIKNSSDKIKIIKIVDRIHNLREIHLTDDHPRIDKYICETERYIISVLENIKGRKNKIRLKNLLLKELESLKKNEK